MKVVVVGAGAVGAACAYFLARAGLEVHVVERGQLAAGTSSSGEGNLLVSEKVPGPELELALYAESLWRTELAEVGECWEYEQKGSLMVASSPAALVGLREFGARQQAAGVEVVEVDADGLADYEPHLRPGFAGAAFYPQDAQLQPMLMTAHLLRLARERGATLATGIAVTGFVRDGERIVGVQTPDGTVSCDAVVNAAGPWAGELAALAGVELPIRPRRGFILVTEPLPPLIRHKVYAGDYVASTQSSDEELQTAPVVEGTRSGTVLIGSSRERVGFDRTVSLPALRTLAAGAMELFPVLAGVRIMRSYLGFRPYCPDHLPVIGADPRAPGLWQANGHEGAGIGLSTATGKLLAQAITGATPDVDLAPFTPARFATVDAHA